MLVKFHTCLQYKQTESCFARLYVILKNSVYWTKVYRGRIANERFWIGMRVDFFLVFIFFIFLLLIIKHFNLQRMFFVVLSFMFLCFNFIYFIFHSKLYLLFPLSDNFSNLVKFCMFSLCSKLFHTILLLICILKKNHIFTTQFTRFAFHLHDDKLFDAFRNICAEQK